MPRYGGGEGVLKGPKRRPGAATLRGLCSAVLLLGFCEVSRAQEETTPGPLLIEFDYEAPPGCLDRERAFSLVHRRSRRVKLSGEQAPTQILSMRIQEQGAEFMGVLSVRRPEQPEERRAMTGSRCDEVVEALALTAALSIDPNATLTLGDPEGESVSEPAPPSEPEVEAEASDTPPEQLAPEPPAPQPPPKREALVQWGLGASLATQRIMDNTLHLGGGADLFVTRLNERWFFPLELRLSLRALLEPVNVEPAVRTQLYLASLTYCPLRWGERHAVALCPFAQVGVISARSVGYLEESEVVRSFATLGAEASLRAFISDSVLMWVSPAVFAPVTRRQFAIDPGPEVLASTLNLGFSVSSGVGYIF